MSTPEGLASAGLGTAGVPGKGPACIVKLHNGNGEVVEPESASSAEVVLEKILGVRGDSFSVEIERELSDFKALRDQVLRREAGLEDLERMAKHLAEKSEGLDLLLGPHMKDVRARLEAA